MRKQTIRDFTERRCAKIGEIPLVITDDFINQHVGNWNFDNWGFCYLDLSKHDLSKVSIETMTKVPFSSSTIWPEKERLPKGFNPEEILNRTSTVGEVVKNLHNKGISGEGITVAVIDNRFQGENHIEFSDSNLVKCTLENADLSEYHFHMEDVLAKLCGKNLGVAPKCKVLYYETADKEDCSQDLKEALEDIKKRIFEGEKIRAVNYSYTITDEESPFKYQQQCLDLVEELKTLNCEVVDSGRFGENFFCCGTTFLNEKDEASQYKVGSFAKGKPYESKARENINIVCSGRTIPEFCSKDGYKYEAIDCFSWTIPQCVGFYVLCLQVNPSLTFDDFVDCCKKSSTFNESGLNVLNPIKLISEAKSFNTLEEEK